MLSVDQVRLFNGWLVNLDLPTMLWVMLVTSFVLAFSVLIVDWQTRSHDGLAMWGWALVANGLSYPAFALRYAGYLGVSVLLSNRLVGSTLSLHMLALRRFQRDRAARVSAYLIWAPVLLACMGALLLLEQHRLRLMYLSSLFAVQSAGQAWIAWGPGLVGEREGSRSLVVIGSIGLGLIFFAGVVDRSD